jgi:hypothetical protein
MAGSWDPTALPIRPGLYLNFVQAAIAQITGGARGIVAIPLKTYDGTAEVKKFYTVEKEQEAIDLFGADNIQSIKLALRGGAKEVLVYTMPVIDGVDITEEEAYTEARNEFEARIFNVFVYDGEISATEQDAGLAWCKRNKDEGKHFMVVFGGTVEDDTDPEIGDARSTRLKDDYSVNLIVGGELSGASYSSGEYAPYIAGLIAGTAINRSITYTQVPLEDVNKRLRNSEIEAALEAGSLVLVHDGEKVKVEQGLCTSGAKIRSIRARQAIATDITKTAADNYIGKLNNNADGQATLISAILAYLENLEVNNVLMEPSVVLDPQRESKGDTVFLLIEYTEVDSMERVFLTINI